MSATTQNKRANNHAGAATATSAWATKPPTRTNGQQQLRQPQQQKKKATQPKPSAGPSSTATQNHVDAKNVAANQPQPKKGGATGGAGGRNRRKRGGGAGGAGGAGQRGGASSSPSSQPSSGRQETVASKTLEGSAPTQAKAQAQEAEAECCLICCDPIEVYAVGGCGHSQICSICCLRRRELYQTNECCICKAQQDKVVFTKTPTNDISTLPLQDMKVDTKRGIYFADESYYEQIMKIWEFSCPLCKDLPPFANLPALKAHLRQKHSRHYCEICLSTRKIFLREQKLYTPSELDRHKQGVGEPEMERHQLCEFCNQLYFDKDDLYNHLTKQHETCHICERDGIRYQYFKNYKALERHFRRAHYLCEDRDCLEQKFIVFRTALDLKAHELAIHMSAQKLSKAQQREARRVDANLLFSESRQPEQRANDRRGGRRIGRDDVLVFSPGPETMGNRERDNRLVAQTPATQTISSQHQFSSSIPMSPLEREELERAMMMQQQEEEKAKEEKESIAEKEEVKESEGKQDKGKQKQKQKQKKKSTEESTSSPTTTGGYLSQADIQRLVREQKMISEEERVERNRALIAKIKSLLGDNTKEFAEFKQQSVDLRTGAITPAQYYSKFLGTFGWRAGGEVFPELVALLPDPILRSALLTLQENKRIEVEQAPEIAEKGILDRIKRTPHNQTQPPPQQQQQQRGRHRPPTERDKDFPPPSSSSTTSTTASASLSGAWGPRQQVSLNSADFPSLNQRKASPSPPPTASSTSSSLMDDYPFSEQYYEEEYHGSGGDDYLGYQDDYGYYPQQGSNGSAPSWAPSGKKGKKGKQVLLRFG